MEIVAESIMFAGKASERRRKVCLRVFRPEPDPRGDYRCVVEVRREVVYGLDSFQALLLAVRRLAGRMSDFLNEGWQFYLQRRDAVPLDVRLAWLGDLAKFEAALPNEPLERPGPSRGARHKRGQAGRSAPRR